MSVGFDWHAPQDRRPVFSNEEGCTRADYVRTAADSYDYAALADAALDGDEWRKDWLVIHHPDLLRDARTALAVRGLGISDEGGFWLIHDLTRCPGCWEAKAIDLPCSGCAAMGAMPGDEFGPDAEDTGSQCRICFRAAAGPPFPFCCSGRARLAKQIEGNGPFKACPVCHGRGAEAHCAACEGTGIDLGEVR